MRVLVVNAGSSSLKLSLLDEADEVMARTELEAPNGKFNADSLATALERLAAFDASAHRVVHGGPELHGPSVVTQALISHLETLAPLAPLHSRPALHALAEIRRRFPSKPAVACFDTAFHSNLPAAAREYALPRKWREKGVRRYGFHGLSHAWVARRAAEMLNRPAPELRIVSCHLGAGASLAAIAGARSVDTTMGFTPLEGLMMSTRAGSVDPGALVWLQRHAGVSVTSLEQGLLHESGLCGLAGTGEMTEVLERAATRDADAALALDVYVHRLAAGIAAMSASLGGPDVVAFTGRIGERADRIRELACERLGFLGIALDPLRNERVDGDAVVSPDGARVDVLVIESREDIQMASETRALLERPETGRS